MTASVPRSLRRRRDDDDELSCATTAPSLAELQQLDDDYTTIDAYARLPLRRGYTAFDCVCVSGVHTEPALRLAERLATNSLGDGSKVFLCNSGAEAVEAALKLARRAKLAGDIVVVRRGLPRPYLRRALGDAKRPSRRRSRRSCPASSSPSRPSKASPMR